MSGIWKRAAVAGPPEGPQHPQPFAVAAVWDAAGNPHPPAIELVGDKAFPGKANTQNL